MLEARSATAAVSMAGKLYVCGGKAGRAYSRGGERFDPTFGTWEALVPMSESRASAVVVSAVGPLVLRKPAESAAWDELRRMWTMYNKRRARHLDEPLR